MLKKSFYLKISYSVFCLNHKAVWFVLLFIPICVSAQIIETANCLDKLKLANTLYADGKIPESIKTIKPCIAEYDATAYFEAQRLLALCYLTLGESDSATRAAEQMLKTRPNYRDFPYFDPLELTKLLGTYDVWPKLEIGLKSGLNINAVRVIKTYSLTQSNATFIPRVGYQAGFFAEYYFSPLSSVRPTIQLEGISYVRQAQDVSSWTQRYSENLTFISLPILFTRKIVSPANWSLFVELGPQIRFLTATTSNISLISNAGSKDQVIRNTINKTKARNGTLYSGLAEITAKHALGEGTISINLSFAYGLNNIVNEKNRWEDINAIIVNQYVDSDISFNTSSISLAYQFPIKGSYVVRNKKPQ